MSEQATQIEINARIQEIERQRDEALTRCAVLAGQVAVFKNQATQLSQELLKYTQLEESETEKPDLTE